MFWLPPAGSQDRFGIDNRVIGDRTGFAVFGSYGNQHTLSGQNSGIRTLAGLLPAADHAGCAL